MSDQFIKLLGKDHDDPTRFAVESIDDNLAISIASVVSKEAKEHNWANNEDATGIYRGDVVTIAMVADAHWGYVASQEAVLRFPGIFMNEYEPGKKDIKQSYLEAILKLCEDLTGVGKKSGVSYGKRHGQEVIDDSCSQFHSVIEIDGKHYFVGIGDCSCNIITSDSMREIESRNRFFSYVGTGLSPRQYMRNTPHEAGLSRDAEVHFNDPLVRNAVDIQELNVSSGDIIFMHTDGYYPIISKTSKEDFTLPELFRNKSVRQGLNVIMDEVIENTKKYGDNIAICAMRVQ